jgi:hypothetical protein
MQVLSFPMTLSQSLDFMNRSTVCSCMPYVFLYFIEVAIVCMYVPFLKGTYTHTSNHKVINQMEADGWRFSLPPRLVQKQLPFQVC